MDDKSMTQPAMRMDKAVEQYELLSESSRQAAVDLREAAEALKDTVPDKWRTVSVRDVVDNDFRVRNPYGEEQVILDCHDGSKASFDDGDTWTVEEMSGGSWETTCRRATPREPEAPPAPE